MNYLLLYVSNILIIVAFLIYGMFILINKKKIATKSNGFNVTKDMLSKYDRINIIENKGYFTYYNIKRKVIKLSSSIYYGNGISDIVISLLEAGISSIDNGKNRIINYFKLFVPNLKCLYILPLMAIGINSVTNNVSDASVSLIFLGIFVMIQFCLMEIKDMACMWCRDRIAKYSGMTKEVKNNVLNKILFLNRIDRLILIGELLMIIRYVAIMLNM